MILLKPNENITREKELKTNPTLFQSVEVSLLLCKARMNTWANYWNTVTKEGFSKNSGLFVFLWYYLYSTIASSSLFLSPQCQCVKEHVSDHRRQVVAGWGLAVLKNPIFPLFFLPSFWCLKQKEVTVFSKEKQDSLLLKLINESMCPVPIS